MIWLEIITLDDGSRVESALPSREEAVGGGPTETYRVHHTDGTTHYFTSMTETLHHLRQRPGIDGIRSSDRGVLDPPRRRTGQRTRMWGPSDSGGT